ncbi:MAG: DUF2231 domain-containing protein [Actinomycetales bacterium]
MFSVFGLPLHPLVVHATVVFVPLAAILVLVAALWPRAARMVGPLPFIVSVLALVLVPITTASGEDLEHKVDKSALLEAHTRLGDQLLPWVIGLSVAAAFMAWQWYRGRKGDDAQRRTPPRGLVLAVTALAVVAAIGTTVQVARIGHSGAEAAWSDVVSSGS